MARALSGEKRQLIMQQSKELFARKGFAATSVADVAKSCRLPVGSIYTYFTNKDELVRAIVEEGWEDLDTRLTEELEKASTPTEKIRLLLDRFLPELLADPDLITILLSEAVEQTRLEEKVERLVSLFDSILAPVAEKRPGLAGFTRSNLESALLVYFLGVLDAVRISSVSSLKTTPDDILDFLRRTVRNTLDLDV
ncbi:MAG: TetR/AcrR family transcriptional regulator [Spirochaetota bacterium]